MYEDVKDTIKKLQGFSEDLKALEIILNNAVVHLYLSMPEGKKNYGGESPQIGKVALSRSAHSQPKYGYLLFADSGEVDIRHSEKIALVNFRAMRYAPEWTKEDEPKCDLPEILRRDTEKVMEALGFEKTDVFEC